MEGMTLSDYLMAEILRSAERPSIKELRERLNQRKTTPTAVPPADAVRQERELH